MIGKLTLLFLIVCVAFVMASTDEEQWSEFKTKYNKSYDTPEEENKRFKIFQDHLREIEEHNKLYDKGEVTWQKGINHFSDLTSNEFAAVVGLRNSKDRKTVV